MRVRVKRVGGEWRAFIPAGTDFRGNPVHIGDKVWDRRHKCTSTVGTVNLDHWLRECDLENSLGVPCDVEGL